MADAVLVEEYNAEWPARFAMLRDRVWPLVSEWATGVEHVGSTAVPGLAAKPVIDLDVVIPGAAVLPEVIARLARLGYAHRGNLGIPEREAFRSPPGPPAHHLYVCVAGSLALRNHLALRDHLRRHAGDREAYAALKRRLARECAGDKERYLAGKTEFILSVLARELPAEAREEIRRVNSGGK